MSAHVRTTDWDKLGMALAIELGLPPGMITHFEASNDGGENVIIHFEGMSTISLELFNRLVAENPPVAS